MKRKDTSVNEPLERTPQLAQRGAREYYLSSTQRTSTKMFKRLYFRVFFYFCHSIENHRLTWEIRTLLQLFFSVYIDVYNLKNSFLHNEFSHTQKSWVR